MQKESKADARRGYADAILMSGMSCKLFVVIIFLNKEISSMDKPMLGTTERDC